MLRIYKKKNIARFPVAVTGNICVGRGISIMSEDFIFDHGILSNCANKNEASQNAGRLKGNMKNWPNYKPPTVFTTKELNRVANEWEEKSRRLAELAFEKQESGDSTIITNEEQKDITRRKINVDKFLTFKEACEFIKKKDGPISAPKGPISKNYSPDEDGFIKSKVRDIRKIWSTTEMDSQKRCNVDNRAKYKLNVCYEDKKDPRSVQFWVCYY